jgi:hypothetical protein
MNPKKPKCRCGKVKTIENTTIQRNPTGPDGFRYLCKECDAIKQRQAGWSDKTDEELEVMRDKHLTNAERVDDELIRRADEWK